MTEQSSKKIRVNPMMSTEQAAEIARATWDASDIGQEEQRRAAYKLEHPEIGDKMPNGTIYAGISPDTGKQMFATPKDALRYMDFNAAAAYAKGLDVGSSKDWRVPTEEELNVLFNNRAAIGGFKTDSCFYWSSTEPALFCMTAQNLTDGRQQMSTGNASFAVRCVRG